MVPCGRRLINIHLRSYDEPKLKNDSQIYLKSMHYRSIYDTTNIRILVSAILRMTQIRMTHVAYKYDTYIRMIQICVAYTYDTYIRMTQIRMTHMAYMYSHTSHDRYV